MDRFEAAESVLFIGARSRAAYTASQVGFVALSFQK
jgi:hypothetical protein